MSAPEQTTQTPPEEPKHVRLSVNIAPVVARTLKEVATRRGTNATEAVRRAISLLKLVDDALLAGGRVVIYPHADSDAGAREIVPL